MAENNHRNDYLVGIDLGGTKILTGIFTPAFECVGLAKISTKSARGPKEAWTWMDPNAAAAIAGVWRPCDYAMPGVLGEVEIISAKLGDHAGITGGAILAKRLK
jgi:hypothetical protein